MDEKIGKSKELSRTRRLIPAVLASLALGLSMAPEATAVDTVSQHVSSSRLKQVCEAEPLVAHRGSVGRNVRRGPDEDTLRSAERAYRLGADISETDWQPSAGGVWFQMHNKTVNATTNGRGVIHTMSTARIRKLRTSDGSHVPDLASSEALLEQYPQKGAQWEFKPEGNPTDKELKEFVGSIVNHDLQDRMMLTSFSQAILRRVDAYTPESIELAWIAPGGDTLPLDRVGPFIDFLNVRYDAANPSYVADAHARGIDVSARSANTPAQWRSLLQRPIQQRPDQIVTDDVAGYRSWCRKLS